MLTPRVDRASEPLELAAIQTLCESGWTAEAIARVLKRGRATIYRRLQELDRLSLERDREAG